MIALIDYGSGNLRSVQKALLKVGGDVHVVQRPEELERRPRRRPPRRRRIRRLRQRPPTPGNARRLTQIHRIPGRPFLGICVGYQALFERSEEFNSCAAGLGIFGGKVVRFPDQPGLKIPQIGWNQIELTQPACPLFRGIPSGSYVYFVHSFFPQPVDPAIIAARTNYGQPFASSVWHKNVFATQFHPEKSQSIGLQLP